MEILKFEPILNNFSKASHLSAEIMNDISCYSEKYLRSDDRQRNYMEEGMMVKCKALKRYTDDLYKDLQLLGEFKKRYHDMDIENLTKYCENVIKDAIVCVSSEKAFKEARYRITMDLRNRLENMDFSKATIDRLMSKPLFDQPYGGV